MSTRPRHCYNVLEVMAEGTAELVTQMSAVSAAQAVSRVYYALATDRFGPEPRRWQIRQVMNDTCLKAVLDQAPLSGGGGSVTQPPPAFGSSPEPCRSTRPLALTPTLPFREDVMSLGMPH